jgi:branched-chain amino acid transport system ATP-binding protein
MTHPELIVLDEATEGLVPPIVDRDYRRVLAHADQALVLQKGQVVLQASAHDVAGSPALSNYLGV